MSPKTIKIKTSVPRSVLYLYNETLRKADGYGGEYDLYGIDENHIGDCVQEIIDDTISFSHSDEFLITLEYLKEEIRWNLTEKLVHLLLQAKEDEEISPKECSSQIRKLHRLYSSFLKSASQSVAVIPWLITQI